MENMVICIKSLNHDRENEGDKIEKTIITKTFSKGTFGFLVSL